MPIFSIGPEHAPVEETAERLAYFTHPTAPSRPRNQFRQDRGQLVTAPLQAVLGSLVFGEIDAASLATSYQSLEQQSLDHWRWHIAGCGLTPAASQELSVYAEMDSRIVVTQLSSETNVTQALSRLLSALVASNAVFGGLLPLGSMLELTVLEKTAWAFGTVRQWDLLGYGGVRDDDPLDLVHGGLHLGKMNMMEARSVLLH